MTLTEFLLARIAEDEAAAVNAKALGADFIGYDTGEPGDNWRGTAGPYDPDRVLADCEAKRAIVGLYVSVQMSDPEYGPSVPIGGDGPEVYYETLQLLARRDAGHPDFDETWAVAWAGR